MQSPDNKVDMAQVNIAIDKVLAVPAAPKAKQKKRRKAEHPPPAKSSKSAAQPAAR